MTWTTSGLWVSAGAAMLLVWIVGERRWRLISSGCLLGCVTRCCSLHFDTSLHTIHTRPTNLSPLAGSYFHYSVPGGYTAPQAKDIGPAKKGSGDPM